MMERFRNLAQAGSKGVPQPKTVHGITGSRLSATVITVHNHFRHGELYGDFLRARKRVFIDHKSWALPEHDGMEFDQYDTPQSRAVIIHDFGQVLGGFRLMPTTARCGCYSYMLRDAQRGLLGDIPEHVLYEQAPVADHIWEATRLFITAEVPSNRRLEVQTRLMHAMATAGVEAGATHVIGIVPAVFQRWMDRLGFSALPLGPKLHIDGDNTQAAAMHVAAQSAQARSGETAVEIWDRENSERPLARAAS